MRRVSVVGNSGSGKTTLGRALAQRLAVPFIELDSIFHQSDWTPLPTDEFRQRVTAMIAGPGWVIDGNYSAVRDLIWAQADTVVWFDLPRPAVMGQIVVRSIRRVLSRAELWNGNREPLTGLFRIDPQHSIIRWAWTQHHLYRRRFSQAAADPANAHLTFIRIACRDDARRLLAMA